jgi:glycosyltransferase involved in cell wall biosynthesis
MKIAYLNQPYPPMISGAAIVTERLANSMVDRGHTVLVVAASDTGSSYVSQERGLRVVRLKSIPNPKRANQRFSPGGARRVSSELKAFQPDVIHSHDLFWFCVAGMKYGRKMKIPVIATIHQLPWFVTPYLPSIPGLRNMFGKLLWAYGIWLSKQCASMIVPTQTIAQAVEEESGIETVVIGNGVDLSCFSPISSQPGEAEHQCQKLRIDPQKPVILHLGRLDLDKRVDIVIRAAAEAMQRCDAQLLVVGDGEYRKRLADLADQLGIGSRSRFPGFLDPKVEVPAVYRIASVFVTASEIETQGLVLLEAMASGLPVVAVDATCIPEVVRHGINGFLADPGDVAGIADRLVEILLDPSMMQRMGAAGRRIVADHAIEDSINDHEELYRFAIQACQEMLSHHPGLSIAD